MRVWLNALLIVLVWGALAVIVTIRRFVQAGGQGSIWDMLTAGAPAWALWAVATPVIFWLASRQPLERKHLGRSLAMQLLFSIGFTILFLAAFTLVDAFLTGQPLTAGLTFSAAVNNAVQHGLFVFGLYWVVTIVAYLTRYMYSEKTVTTAPRSFDNAILIKTNYGYVMVEIEKFQYVKGGERKIMFHTGRSKHLNRQRAVLEKGKLVEQERYRPDRSIVVDLAKIRRARMTGPDTYVFHIGFSHELIFNREMYQKLGGWLPAPVLDYKPQEKA